MTRYRTEMMLSLTAYAVVLVISLKLLNGDAVGDPALRSVVTLLPVAPVLAIAWVCIRQLGRLDEFQRQIQLHALGISFVGTAVLTIAWGFLENVGAPKLPTFAIWPLMGLLWAAATQWISHRHRVGEE